MRLGIFDKTAYIIIPDIGIELGGEGGCVEQGVITPCRSCRS
jgi:hypothetical protein